MVIRFDTGKVLLWAIIVTPQSVVLSCCDVDNERRGKKMYIWDMGMGSLVG